MNQGPHAGNQDGLTLFMQSVLADPALQARLGAIALPDHFVAEATALAGTLGMTLSEEAVRAAIRPDILGLSRFADAPVNAGSWPGIGWLPARSVQTGGAPAFDWAWFGADPVDDSFYEDSVRRMAPRPFNTMFRTRTGLEALVAGASVGAESLPPSGFIFHMSRCGSTLVSQMLAAVPDHIVISEAEPIDAVVQWAASSGAPLDTRVAALRAIVAAFGQNRSGTARRYFLKLDSWHAPQLPLFRAAFPDVPWLFLYREPVEVMVSQANMPGAQFVPGVLPPTALGVDAEAATSPEDYGAIVLAHICQAALDHWDPRGMAVNYRDLRLLMAEAIPAHFGFLPDADARSAMAVAGMRDAKAPSRTFTADVDRKRAAVTPAILAAVERHLRRPYDLLEELAAGAGGRARSLRA